MIKKLKELEKEHKDILSGLSDKEEIKEETSFIRTVYLMPNLNILKICKRQKIVNMMHSHLNIT